MVDAALIQQCADPDLKPAIVEQFIAAAGAPDPRAVTVRARNRVILTQPPKTAEEAMDLVRRYVGQTVVRVGITQYPAGVGISDPAELSADLVDACTNIRMGTALFAKVYRIVTKWYGAPAQEAFDDAILAWQTGWFEGQAVFSAEDPGPTPVAVPAEPADLASAVEEAAETGAVADVAATTEDPNHAGIRIDLSGIGGAGLK